MVLSIVNATAREFLKKHTPGLFDTMRRVRQEQYAVRSMRAASLLHHGFKLAVPVNHSLREISEKAPRREEGLRIAARFLFAKDATGAYVDIGANVGDTAAVVRSVASWPMVLVEPSKTFFSYLERNAPLFGPDVKLVKGFLAAPSDVGSTFTLSHWGGTAKPVLAPSPVSRAPDTFTLDEVCDGPVRLLKIDTDGYDLPLLHAYSSKLAAEGANLFFELEVRSLEDVQSWSDLTADLLGNGYSRLLVWDDPGHFMGSIDSAEQIAQLIRWQHSYQNSEHAERARRHGAYVRICNFDVLAVAERDDAVADEILAWYRAQQGMPE